ncbi:MAG: conserved phage C-terminal domain-containing protein [Rectinema sp.]
MKRGKRIDPWFPLWIDKWIFGSTRHELIVKNDDGSVNDLRGVFIDLASLAKKDDGFIRANEKTPYPVEQLAGMFCVPVEQIKLAISKCLEHGKFSEPAPGIYYLNSNDTYSLTPRHVRRLSPQKGHDVRKPGHDVPKSGPLRIGKDRIGKDSRGEDKISSPVVDIISYLNEKTGKKFSPKSKDTIEHISARIAEGRTVEDFKHVIDTKCAEWKGKTWKDTRDPGKICRGDDYLRPSTLFAPKNFENYVNQTPPAEPQKKLIKVWHRDGTYHEEEVES